MVVALATNEAGEEHILVLVFFLTGEDNLLGIDDHDEVAGINGGGVGSFVTAANQVGGFDGETTEDFAFGIDKMPLGVHCLFLGEIRFHEKRGGRHKRRTRVSTVDLQGNEKPDPARGEVGS